MDSKVEGYYNFIVDDIIKNSEIKDGRIQYPIVDPLFIITIKGFRFNYPFEFLSQFKEYLIDNYGLEEKEMDTIWKMLVLKLREVNNG